MSVLCARVFGIDYNAEMTTPLTPLDKVFAVLQLVSNIPSELQKSAEQWIDEMQKNLTAFSEQFAKGMAEYDKVEVEAFEVLKRGGWLGMERHLTGPQVRTILAIAKTSGESAAYEAIRNYFSASDCALLVAMSEQWLDIPYFKDRERIVRDAIAAHGSGHYTLTVPALLPLAEGLSAEIAGNAAGRQNVVKAVAREWKAREQEVWTELYSDVVIHVIYKTYDFTKDPAPYLNRNGILHGRVSDYGTELNSLRVFLLVDCVADLWQENQRKKNP
jgi:hypothetical protein